MSNIPKARKILEEALFDGDDYEDAIYAALALMRRVPFIRCAPEKRQVISKTLRMKVKRMAKRNPDLTMMQIAVMSGLRSQGRVSEILHGKR